MPREYLLVLSLTDFMFLALILCKAISVYRFQSEKETGDRNFAIGYYLKEKKVCCSNCNCFSSFCLYYSTKELLFVFVCSVFLMGQI